jgi:hypothetical protein
MTSPSAQDTALLTTLPEADAPVSQDRLPYQAPSLVTLHLKQTANNAVGVGSDGPKFS